MKISVDFFQWHFWQDNTFVPKPALMTLDISTPMLETILLLISLKKKRGGNGWAGGEKSTMWENTISYIKIIPVKYRLELNLIPVRLAWGTPSNLYKRFLLLCDPLHSSPTAQAITWHEFRRPMKDWFYFNEIVSSIPFPIHLLHFIYSLQPVPPLPSPLLTLLSSPA